jgi:hypothetical protein
LRNRALYNYNSKNDCSYGAVTAVVSCYDKIHIEIKENMKDCRVYENT